MASRPADAATAYDLIRAALGKGRATAIAQAIADEPPAHTLSAEVEAARAPFDAALDALEALVEEASIVASD